MIKSFTRFHLLLLCCFMLIGIQLHAQNGLYESVTKAHVAGTTFANTSLFSVISGDKHPGVLRDETLLSVNTQAVSELYKSQPGAVTLQMQLQSGKVYKLEMLLAHPTAANFNFGYIATDGRHKATYDAGVHYQGAVQGVKQSLATLSVFANGDVMVLFANEEGNFVAGKLMDGSGKYVLYNDKDFINPPAMKCGVKEDGTSLPNNSGNKTTKAYGCNKVQLYWEIDYDMYSFNTNLTNTQTYMTGLFNQFQAMYNNEKIAVELKSLYVWTTPDGYPFNTSSDGLDIFKGYWNNLGDNFDGDIAHFITKDNSSNGGLAYLDVLCNKNWAYAYSEIKSSFNVVPTYSWDVMVLSHETGHNLGSHHTHWCGWMTGPSGTCGSIDNCTTQEASSSCSTCPKTFDNAAATGAWSGTVMSYCHLVSRGINLANGFGPLPGNVIRTQVSNASCLQSIISAQLATTSICNNDGVINLTYNSNNMAAAPYTYSWTGGGSNQNKTGISTPGNYTVTVTDSNGCTQLFQADIKKLARPGDAKPTGYILPVCCNSSPVSVTLTANLPTDLQACQTVGWLRTTTPIASFSAAQTAFAGAAATDKILSTNSSSISNSTAATLKVNSPTPCAAQSYYYTPFITRKTKSANNISSTVSSGSNFTNNGTILGYAVTIPDQTSSLGTCDQPDTPVLKTLSATVSSYTGRANNLTLLVQDASGLVIYRKTGLAGNGTYTIPVISTMSNPLQELLVSAFDFNCVNSSACTPSSLSLSVSRSVNYAAIPAMTFEAVCVVGQSVQLSFAPENCEHASGIIETYNQPPYLNVYPNPASKSVTVRFFATKNDNTMLKVTDMLGKVVVNNTMSYHQGDNEMTIDIHNWAKGVYFISVQLGDETYKTKLVVE